MESSSAWDAHVGVHLHNGPIGGAFRSSFLFAETTASCSFLNSEFMVWVGGVVAPPLARPQQIAPQAQLDFHLDPNGDGNPPDDPAHPPGAAPALHSREEIVEQLNILYNHKFPWRPAVILKSKTAEEGLDLCELNDLEISILRAIHYLPAAQQEALLVSANLVR